VARRLSVTGESGFGSSVLSDIVRSPFTSFQFSPDEETRNVA
jgi:hypothetical protein